MSEASEIYEDREQFQADQRIAEIESRKKMVAWFNLILTECTAMFFLSHLMLMIVEVEIASHKSAKPADIDAQESELWKMMKGDPYFSSLPDLEQSEVQTLGHLESTRDTAELLPDIDSVMATFELHTRALARLTAVGTSLVTAATEWKSSRKAIKKALELERTAREREEAKQAKKIKKAEDKRRQQELRQQQQEQEQNENPDDQNKTRENQKKRRNGGARITGQLSDSDPRCLVEKFDGQYKINVIEELADWLQQLFLVSLLM